VDGVKGRNPQTGSKQPAPKKKASEKWESTLGPNASFFEPIVGAGLG